MAMTLNTSLQNLTWATLDFQRNCTLAEQYIDLKYEEHRSDSSWTPPEKEQYDYFMAWLPVDIEPDSTPFIVFQQWAHTSNMSFQDGIEVPLRRQCLSDYCKGLKWRPDPDLWGIGCLSLAAMIFIILRAAYIILGTFHKSLVDVANSLKLFKRDQIVQH
ncbi:uncharacterized protein B0I36DRAFT_360150 [Microdochium trichocladiopsis]|uniref:Uncharacterized protein n=1 Tax=Microdochium trichocladiopsis TaxID=1682393 RepID=A0A9P8YD54_9PEZI|nr:uncharacterized protein B0I36DRAFT_360150 [Microdochium trichocladiopsis]KAH7034647.1 hypothetical protein B0I36DRAFT_360150 [Microdochium trichocladiopsis]